MKTVKFSDLKKNLLESEGVKAEYAALANEFSIAQALISARTKAKLSQKEVADRMHTSQSSVARMESGIHMPSVASIEKFATAVGRPIRLEIYPVAEVA